ncbi:MAG: MBOAT family protein [Phycisphaerales bacterium]|nr:MBOAT family protein [Phycisphaerales bacterium]
MLFNSPAFAVFLPVMLVVYWSLRGRARQWALLLGSYFFYSVWDVRFTSLLVISTLVDYFCGLSLARTDDPRRRKMLVTLSVVVNLGILASFKYFNFFRDSLATVLAAMGVHAHLPMLDVVLPMGISFYTFQSMSYTIDVYRGMPVERSFLAFATYVTCFPQLVAGPIMRAQDLLPQLNREQRLADADFSMGMFRIFRGLFKKMVIADSLGIFVDMVFHDPGDFSGISCWFALYAYAFQIYMDFSGYCDVAVGAGHMLGLRMSENFNLPYLAASPSEFWHRWHITLSTWLRDYLYIPLGGSRCSRRKTMRNLFITMGLGGLWHGAAWTFVAWGIYHGLLLSVQRLINGGRPGDPSRDPFPLRVLKVFGMFHLTCIGWLLFRAQDWATVQLMLTRLVDFSSTEIRGKRIVLIVLACMFVHVLPAFRGLGERFVRLPGLVQGSLAGMCLWAVILLNPGVKAFIYFQF